MLSKLSVEKRKGSKKSSVMVKGMRRERLEEEREREGLRLMSSHERSHVRVEEWDEWVQRQVGSFGLCQNPDFSRFLSSFPVLDSVLFIASS